MGKWINLEFFHPIIRHISNLQIRNFTIDWLVPLIFTILIVNWLPLSTVKTNSFEMLKNIVETIINAISILIGFTMAIEAILVSGSSSNLEKIKKVDSSHIVNGKRISIFQEMINSYTFIVIIEFFVLIANIITIIMCNAEYGLKYINLLYGINLFFIFALASLNIRNTTNLYFIFWRKEEDNNNNELSNEVSEQQS